MKIYVFGDNEETTRRCMNIIADATDNKHEFVSRAVYYPEYDKIRVIKNILLSLEGSDFIILLNERSSIKDQSLSFSDIVKGYALLHNIPSVEVLDINDFIDGFNK